MREQHYQPFRPESDNNDWRTFEIKIHGDGRYDHIYMFSALTPAFAHELACSVINKYGLDIMPLENDVIEQQMQATSDIGTKTLLPQEVVFYRYSRYEPFSYKHIGHDGRQVSRDDFATLSKDDTFKRK